MFPQKNLLIDITVQSIERRHEEIITAAPLRQLWGQIPAAVKSLQLINSLILWISKSHVGNDGQDRILLTAHHG